MAIATADRNFAPSLVVLLVAVAAFLGCAPALAPVRPEPMAPPPIGLREIDVTPPANRTCTALVVNDPGLLTSFIEEKTTVPEVLGADLRSVLVQRGYRVERVGKDAPKLSVEIRRWEHYSADYSRVTVDLSATLEDDGRRLWSLERTNWRVATPNSGSAGEASNQASEVIAEALLEGWQAGAPAAR